MKRYKRWAAGALAAVMLIAVSLSVASAESLFGEFRLDASGIDKPVRDISVHIYRRDETGQFQVAGTSQYSCTLNRATSDASFFIQANTDGVWVSVDYLTDIDGDGTYELLDDPDSPVWDVMDAQGGLSRPKAGEAVPILEPGQPFLLVPETLLARSRQAVQERAAGGACQLDPELQTAADQDFPLFMVKLHRTDPAGGPEDTLVFYLQLYGDILVPFDVSPSDPYYSAIGYVLSQGYFSGNGNGLFLPQEQLARAHMAQVLWAMARFPEGTGTGFSDVPESEWYYKPISWCQQSGLILGYETGSFGPMDPLSREQMITILYRSSGSPAVSDSGRALSGFSDADRISPWALDAMAWAASNGLLPDAGALEPQELVTRAELAAAIYAYAQSSSLSR